MKKTTLIFLLLGTTMVCYAQYTAVPDPYFEDFLEMNGMGDGVPGNGQVLTANIENVTDLVLPFNGDITNITGIEDFISLEYLDASFNNIATVDLSENLLLETLVVAYNNLSSLDLSSNINLKYLNCQNNELNILILNSEYLIEVYCFENQLTDLDVSKAHLLTYLDCNFNNLFSLDVNQNENLNFLIASGNNLSELNVSNNSDLTYLNVGENNIISLDLSHNQNLISFLGPYNSPLDFLDIRNGNNANMNGINVTGTNALKCVFVDDASASYLDDWYIDPFTTFVNNEAECDALSVSSYEREQLLLYPNPTKGSLTVSFSKPAEYIITDVNGKTLKIGKLNLGLSRITINELSTGLYLFKVKTDSGSITKKLIKQ